MIELNNYNDLKALFKEHDQLIIHHYLEEDIVCIGFDSVRCEISLYVPNIVAKDIPNEISKHLLKWTGKKWVIFVRALKESILQEAERIIKERGEEYGDSDDCLGLVAAWWNYYMNHKVSNVYREADNPEWDGTWCYEELITPHDTALMMCMLKIARAATGKKKRDNYVDIAGYAALAANL